MDSLAIDFSKENKEIEELIIEVFGDDIRNNFIESKNFNGDIVNIIATVIIPIAMPIITVLFQKYLEKKEDKDTADKITIIYNHEEFIFKHNDINVVNNFLLESKGVSRHL